MGDSTFSNKLQHQTKKPSGWERSLKDCLAGSVGGSFQVLAGQPFDTIKVRLQAQGRLAVSSGNKGVKYTGVWDCVLKTFQEGGVVGFYKGTLAPLVGVGVCVSIQFFSLEHMKRYFSLKNQLVSDKPNQLSTPQLYVSGAVSGLLNTVVAGPVEHIRTRLQLQTQNNPTFSGPMELVRHLVKTQGVCGLYKGQVATVLRDFHAYGVYFAIYETLIQGTLGTAATHYPSRSDIPLTLVASYGIVSGVGYWVSVYPIDVLKTQMQTDGFGVQAKYKGITDCFRQVLNQEGVHGFFKGLSPCLLRTIPAASATFLGFELAMKYLN